MEAARKELSDKDELLLLVLDHLREHLDPAAWYSLPLEVVEALSMQKILDCLLLVWLFRL